MPTINIDFTTEVADDYKVIKDRIVPVHGKLEKFRPLEINGTLYLQFSMIDDEPESYVEFMRTFGPITYEGYQEGERIQNLKNLRSTMADLINMVHEDPKKLGRWFYNFDQPTRNSFIHLLQQRSTEAVGIPEASLLAFVRPAPPDGRPRLSLVPNTLMDAMKFQFYQAVSSGARIKSCKWCGNMFTVGGTGKRGDAKFCKDNCRLLQYRQNARDARKGGRK